MSKDKAPKAAKAAPKDTPTKAGRRKLPGLGHNKGLSPAERKRVKWLSGLWANRVREHYPRLERVKDEATGAWETRELTPQPVATRGEFMGPNHYGHGEPFMMTKDVANIPAREAAERERMATWRMRHPTE